MNFEFELSGTEMPFIIIILLPMMPILMTADSATENHTVVIEEKTIIETQD
jgi:hypothetical protein